MQKIMLVMLLLVSTTLSAQRRQWDRPMQLQRCLVDIKADPFTATTFIEMEFYNPNSEDIEGMYRFQLNQGQVITAFQLDLNGQYRDGSIEEKWKATNAYNTIVGKRIDPALLTMEGLNNYNLRIFPVPAKGTRRVSLTIRQLMKEGKGTLDYLLPMNVSDTVSTFDIRIAVNNSPEKAYIKEGFLKNHVFWGTSPSWIFHTSFRQVVLNQPISFHLPVPRQTVSCISQKGSLTHFAAVHQPNVQRQVFISPKKITVFWDASASGNTRDTRKEISFLKQYIAYHNISQLTIIPFNFRVQDTAVFYTAGNFNSRWETYLDNIQYDGATSFGSLDFSGITTDVTLMFSDGTHSYGKGMPREGKSMVYCITSSRHVQGQLLKLIGNSGGSLIDLEKLKISEAMEKAKEAENILMDVRSASGKTVIDQQTITASGRVRILGSLWGGLDTLVLSYGNNSRITAVERIVIDGRSSCASSGIDRIEALTRFESILNQNQWDKMLAFGKKERMVTPYTAFIVLERIEDYVKYQIEPPKDIEEECIRAGYVKRDRLGEFQKITREQRLAGILASYRYRMYRWDQSLVNPGDVKSVTHEIYAGPGTNGNVSKEAVTLSPQASMEEVVVIGYGAARKRDMAYSVTTIRPNDLLSGVSSIEQALEGRVAGLHVTPPNGAAGLSGNIRIRGTGTFTGNQPLYVLDGVPIAGDINDLISVSDIESITVMKDMNATALYGSRGANGVIAIESKKGKAFNFSYFSRRPYRLKNMEDVDYLKQLKSVSGAEKINTYRELQPEHGHLPGFYLDAAQHLYESGFKEQALVALTNAAEVSHGSFPVLTSIAFTLELWKEYGEAIRIYEYLKEAAADIHVYRNLAMAYERAGRYQAAAATLHEAVTRDWEGQENSYHQAKELLVNELNSLVSTHKGMISDSLFRELLVKPLPVDLRIVIEGNYSGLNNLCIRYDKNEICNNSSGTGEAWFSNGLHGAAEFQMKVAKRGRYRITGRFYENRFNALKTPKMVRVIVYKNFGRPNQTVETQNIIMDNQNGEVEFAEVNW